MEDRRIRKKASNEFGGIGWGMSPPSIMIAPDLTPSQKLLWGRINGLKADKGYCYAWNEFLGEAILMKKGTVANLISKMVELGYLERTLVYRKGNKEIHITKFNSDVDVTGYKLIERRLVPIEIFQEDWENSKEYELFIDEAPPSDSAGNLQDEVPTSSNETPSLSSEALQFDNEHKEVLDLELESSIREECVENTDTPANNKNDKQKTINDADEVITHIENIAEKEAVKLNFDRTTKSRADIIEGLKKYSVDELKLVAEMKCKEWIGDTKTMGWVNPNTLFRDGKINNNVVAARAWDAKGKPKVNGRSVGYRGVQSDDDYGAIVK